jgi:ferredoxin-NADP reductase
MKNCGPARPPFRNYPAPRVEIDEKESYFCFSCSTSIGIYDRIYVAPKGFCMAAVRIKLLSRLEVAEGTVACFFEKPDGFDFKAGQSGDFTLINPPETDAEGNTRAFSIASPPHEPDLMIATRMRDTAFKRVLKNLPIGTELNLEGPFGALTLHNNAKRPAVFLAGGIGITPFRSILLHAAGKHLPHQLYLFYSNRYPEAATFLEDLIDLEKQNPRYRLIATMDEVHKSHRGWSGEMGHINETMLTKYLKTLEGPVYYVAGPPGMVTALQKMLNEAGVNDDDIRIEAFSGYS